MDAAPRQESRKPQRQDNRRQDILDRAAALFADKGYHATSIRDIATASGMTPGAVYVHFQNKAALLLAVYDAGAGRIGAAVDAAVAAMAGDDPWAVLEAACRAHLETLLDRSAYARVVIRVLPADIPEVAADLTAIRDAYEGRFRALLDDRLPNGAWARLMLMGAMNWTQVWYHPDRGRTPARIAAEYVAVVRAGCDTKETPP